MAIKVKEIKSEYNKALNIVTEKIKDNFFRWMGYSEDLRYYEETLKKVNNIYIISLTEHFQLRYGKGVLIGVYTQTDWDIGKIFYPIRDQAFYDFIKLMGLDDKNIYELKKVQK